MFERILVVCQGNVCRSPLAATMLRDALPGREIGSAGLGALVGHDIAPLARQAASRRGLDCGPHSARQLDAGLCREHDLILVMERKQRERILRDYPGGSGKTFLLGHWSGGADIPDPWQKNEAAYEETLDLIERGVRDWIQRLENRDS